MDLQIRGWINSTMPPWGITCARALARLGQGGPLSLLALVVCVFETVHRRNLQAIFQWAMTFILLLALVLPQKIFFRRGAPGDPINAVRFFSKPFCGTPACQSYPSGHAANAVVWYGVIAFALSHYISEISRRAIQIALVSVVALAAVVSGYHWLTDTIAGLFLGILVRALAIHAATLISGLNTNFNRPRWRVARRDEE